MTAPVIIPEVGVPMTADEVITYGRALYRAAQDMDCWPAEGRDALLRASSRLATEIQVCTRVLDDGFTVTPGRIASARKAASELIAALHAYCGPEAAAHIGGEDKAVAA